MPEWRTEILRRLAGTRLRAEREAEIVDEVAQHLDDRYREKIAVGQTPAEAEASAWEELDADDVLAREIARAEPAARPMPPPGAPARGSLVASIWNDIRYAVRRLKAQPAFAVACMLTLALSIGPATAVIGVADHLFFRPLPGATASDQLFNVSFGRKSARGLTVWFVSYANVDAMIAGAKTIAGMTGSQPMSVGLSVNGAEPRREQGESVRFNFFDVLGVGMVAGRGFIAEEDSSPGGVASVVLAEPLAQELFGGAQNSLGKVVLLNSEPFTVVGVSKPEFEGERSTKAKFWITGQAYNRATHRPPARWTYEGNRGPFYQFVVRVAPGASVTAANDELRARAAALAEAGGEGSDLFKTVGPQMQPGLGAPRSLNQQAYSTVRILAGVAGLLVLLGMANAANLLVFRSLKAGRDIAIRKALGASVARLIQATIVECLVLSLAGAALGVAIALGIQEFLSDVNLWRLGPLTVPLDWRVIGSTAALAVIVGVGFGVGPALLSARGPLMAGLGRGTRNDAPRGARLRQALATLQLALSLALLVGAMLFLSTLRHLRGVDLGIDPAGVTTTMLELRSHGYDKPRTLAFHRQLLERLSHEPGIEHAAVTYSVPTAGGYYVGTAYLPGQDPKNDGIDFTFNGATSQFFDAMRMRIIKGRAFTETEGFDTTASPSPVILSATAARKLFGDTDPIGRLVMESPKDQHVVIGVAADVRWEKITSEPDTMMYLAWGTFPLNSSQAMIVTRSSGSSAEIARLVRQAAASLDPNVPLFPEKTMASVIDRGLAEQQLFARVLGLLGAIGFVLAAVGLHGLISQMVRERLREFGIRLAVGAERRSIVGLLVKQAAVVAAVGLLGGLVTAALSARLIEASLFGVTSRDPLVYASAAGMLIVVVAIALVGPARAALGVEPISVLRSE